jgi:hypothetical protein
MQFSLPCAFLLHTDEPIGAKCVVLQCSLNRQGFFSYVPTKWRRKEILSDGVIAVSCSQIATCQHGKDPQNLPACLFLCMCWHLATMILTGNLVFF